MEGNVNLSVGGMLQFYSFWRGGGGGGGRGWMIVIGCSAKRINQDYNAENCLSKVLLRAVFQNMK